MTPQDYAEFSKLITSISELYGQKTPSEFVISIWWQAMKDFDIKTVRLALSAHVTNPDNGQFMPKPADVVRLLGGTTKDKALMAWATVDKAVRQVGSWQDVVFDDPVIHAVIMDMGGWVCLSEKGMESWDFVKNEFVTRYRAYSTQGGVSVWMPVLTGRYNAHNASNGYRLNAPILLGDKEKAKQVYLSGSSQNAALPRHTLLQ